MSLVVFLPRPEGQYMFWAPCNKNSQIPEVALVDFTPERRQWWSWWLECACIDDQGLFYYKVGIISKFRKLWAPSQISINQSNYLIPNFHLGWIVYVLYHFYSAQQKFDPSKWNPIQQKFWFRFSNNCLIWNP